MGLSTSAALRGNRWRSPPSARRFPISGRNLGREGSITQRREDATLAAAVRDGLSAPLEGLKFLPAFFEASADVTRQEFETFVSESLRETLGVYAFEWVPIVRRFYYRVPRPGGYFVPDLVFRCSWGSEG